MFTYRGDQAFFAEGGRATVIGPGVTPDVMWEGPAPGAYDPAGDAEANAAQRALLGPDPLCKVN